MNAWPAGLLSHGDKRKLELAMLLAADTRVLLLDEPMAGVSMEDVPELVELIRSVHADEGKTVLMVEHHMEVVIGLAERIAVMHGGRASRRGHARRDHGQRDGAAGVPRGGALVPPLVSVHDLHVYLGESHVLQGISFDVPDGGVTALLGRNGVGKTTTLRALMGLVERRGTVELAGEDIRSAAHAQDRPPRRRVRPRGS